MSSLTKRIEELTEKDLNVFPVWEYANDDVKHAETAVRPIKRVPVKTLAGRFVGDRVRLANGTEVWGIIGNVDASNPRATRHFLTLSVLRNGRWFTMARYHDVEYGERGPEGLASFLNLQVDEVFPIAYDITQFCAGVAAALSGTIERESRERLTRAQIIELAVP